MNQCKKTCCIFNYAPHYRNAIFRKLHSALNAEFYFGANLIGGETIKKINLEGLPGFRKEFKVRQLGPFRWSCGWLKLAFCERYDKYLITQDLYAINQWLFLIVCKMLRKPVYVWTHGLRQNPKNQIVHSKTTEFLRLWQDGRIAGYFLYGDRAKENMWLAGFDLDKLHVVYNSLDYDKMFKLRGKTPPNPYKEIFHNEAPVIVFIGRLTKVKKLDMAVNVVQRLLERGIEVNLAFLGDGPAKESLQGMIENWAGGHFHFAGSVYDPDIIHSYLYHATLCLSPGNVGLTAITCLSEGLPVITHDNLDEQMPEVEAISPGVTGELFRKDDLDDLTEKTSQWLDKLSSSKQRDEARVQCYKIIDQRYNPDFQAKVFKEVICK